jgi:phosphopantothenoylcysteine synthetase/decarboxylase
MKVLITAGSTNVMIDQVRCISNIFKGETGEKIADYFSCKSENKVTLITSNKQNETIFFRRLHYKTYDELYALMEQEITTGNYDVVIHSAAVSDYKVEGTYVFKTYPQGDKRDEYGWVVGPGPGLAKVDSSKKISSDNKELYLKLVPTEKIIDKIRKPWGFNGVLVKFKLQVGITDLELLEIAKKSMATSKADFIVANCLEWSKDRAYILRADESPNSFNGIASVSRDVLANRLLEMIEGKVGDKL